MAKRLFLLFVADQVHDRLVHGVKRWPLSQQEFVTAVLRAKYLQQRRPFLSSIHLIVLPKLHGLMGHSFDEVLAGENRVSIGPLVRLNFETDEDGDSCCTLHRLPAASDYAYYSASLISW